MKTARRPAGCRPGEERSLGSAAPRQAGPPGRGLRPSLRTWSTPRVSRLLLATPTLTHRVCSMEFSIMRFGALEEGLS